MLNRDTLTATGFAQYLAKKTGQDIVATKILETHIQKRPDFILKPLNYLVEVKGIHDRTEVKENAVWFAAISRLHKAIDANSKKKLVKGSYTVDTPEGFRLPQSEEVATKVAEEILEQLVSASPKTQITVNVNSFVFEANRYSKKYGHVGFSRNWGGTIDAAGTIHQNIFTKLMRANEQLSYSPDGLKIDKRILLLDNEYAYGDIHNVIKALSYSFEDLSSLDSIDEIWLQSDRYHDKIDYELVFTREFITDFLKGKSSLDADWLNMFGRWSVVLGGQEKYHENILSIMRILFQDKKPDEVIINARIRSELVHVVGDWLKKERRFDDASWFVKQFITDNDPPSTFDKATDRTDYDNEIRNGKDDVFVITTVLGHLAWTVQGLTISRQHIASSLSYTQTLVSHPNLYVKLQAMAPLIEITKRRQWLKELDKENQTNYYNDLKALDFGLLRDYSQYPALANRLTRVFFEFRDLTTDEVCEVLETLKGAENAYTLYVYFALFRKRHFIDEKGVQEVQFDSTVVEDKLRGIIDDYDKNSKLLSSIAWQLAKLIRNTPEEFNTVKPWIDYILTKPYIRNAYDDVERALPKVFELEPAVAANWLKQILDKIHDCVTDISFTDEQRRSIWLSMDSVIKDFAKTDSASFDAYLRKVFDIWEAGIYIGSPTTILTAYEYLEEKALRSKSKKLSQDLYRKMKKINPTLEAIEWS